MFELRALFLMPEDIGCLVSSFAADAGIKLKSTIVSTIGELEAEIGSQNYDLLLSFQTGVIVPEHIFLLPGLVALNVHAASPDFPGRDPHHFAVYAGAKQYGATIHYMTERVDQGPIVDVELFDVPTGSTPEDLLNGANEAGFILIGRFFKSFVMSGFPDPRGDLTWNGRVTKRKDFIELCRVDCSMSADEFERRLRATRMAGFSNLFIDMHGCRFRLEAKNK